MHLHLYYCIQDYTLAQYKPETFEHLAYSQTVHQLTTNFGYPQELRQFEFDWQYMMRGLTIDKVRGNVIKVDRHKYVKLAFHGLTRMSKEQRQKSYLSGTQRHSFDTDDYTTIDTLFSLAEAYLFMQIVDLKDSGSSEMLTQKPYKVCLLVCACNCFCSSGAGRALTAVSRDCILGQWGDRVVVLFDRCRTHVYVAPSWYAVAFLVNW